jgi:hypothetical protein
MPNQQHDYQLLYNGFINGYQKGVADAADVGEVIARLAQFYATYNESASMAEVAYNNKAAELEGTIEPESGKPISSAKAKVMTQATIESAEVIRKKMHLENIEQYINALKYLQRGLSNEFGYMGAQ